MSREYKAFISYRHTPLDIKVAKAVHTLVEQYRIPKEIRRNGEKRMGLVFRDQEELPVSSNLSDDICTALDHAEFLIVICTPNTPKSIWVQREIEYFLSKHPRERVLTVLAEGEPDEAFPEQLRFSVDPVTGEKKDVEPLACDCRAKNDREVIANMKKESPRLFAAMLGCPYDALVMREQKRRRKQFIAYASVIFSVLFSFTAFAIANNIKLNDKNTELLRRESEMLIDDAKQALDEEDYAKALSLAVDALPDGEDENRPYIADAESILIEALDIFDKRDSELLVIEDVLTQNAEIVSFNTSPDGSKLVAVNFNSTVNMYDTQSMELLYSIATDHWFSNKSIPVFAGDCFILHSKAMITAHSIKNGELLWSYDKPNTDFADGILINKALSEIVCMERQLILEDGLNNALASVVRISIEDGEVLNTIELGITDLSSTMIPVDITFRGNTHWGDLSEDGSAMAGAYVTYGEGLNSSVIYYVADFNKNTVNTVYTTTGNILTGTTHSPVAIKYDSDNTLIKLYVPRQKITPTLHLYV